MTDAPKPPLTPAATDEAARPGLATLRLGLDRAVRQARLARRDMAAAEATRARLAAEGPLQRLMRRLTGR